MNENEAMRQGLTLCFEHGIIYKNDNRIVTTGAFVDAVWKQLCSKEIGTMTYDLNEGMDESMTPLQVAIFSTLLAWSGKITEEELALMSVIMNKLIVPVLNTYWEKHHPETPKPKLW